MLCCELTQVNVRRCFRGVVLNWIWGWIWAWTRGWIWRRAGLVLSFFVFMSKSDENREEKQNRERRCDHAADDYARERLLRLSADATR
jgi:hypothetical protein